MSTVRETISFEHAQVHRGLMHRAAYLQKDVTNGASAGIVIATGASKDLHISFVMKAGGKFFIALHKDPVLTSCSASLVSVMNLNDERSLSLTASMGGCPVWASASLLTEDMIPGGGAGGNRFGGEARSGDEFELAPCSMYIIAASNDSGGTVDWLLVGEAYEA